jgi:hypothetical protein
VRPDSVHRHLLEKELNWCATSEVSPFSAARMAEQFVIPVLGMEHLYVLIWVIVETHDTTTSIF